MIPTVPNSELLSGSILVLGATGKTGRRVAARLTAMGVAHRRGSRSATPAFDWNDHLTWRPCLEDVAAVYVNYPADLPVTDAPDAIRAFVDRSKEAGVQRLVLLTGRGEEVGRASERAVQESGLEWTIVRSSWFNQNFSEGGFAELVESGQLILPAGGQREPFVDLGDLADVVVAALTKSAHSGEVYDVTGPRLMTFADVASDLSDALGRKVAYVPVPHDSFLAGLAATDVPDDAVALMDYLFGTLLDGRNAHLGDGVVRALGRAPRDFRVFARAVAGIDARRAVV